MTMKAALAVAVMLLVPWANASVTASDAKIRLLPPGVPNTAAYLRLQNTGAEERHLVGATASVTAKMELHDHIMRDGLMSMEQQQQVTIGPGETVVFQPGGLHLMMFDLKQPLKAKQTVAIELRFANGEVLEVEAIVSKKIGKSHHHH